MVVLDGSHVACTREREAVHFPLLSALRLQIEQVKTGFLSIALCHELAGAYQITESRMRIKGAGVINKREEIRAHSTQIPEGTSDLLDLDSLSALWCKKTSNYLG